MLSHRTVYQVGTFDVIGLIRPKQVHYPCRRSRQLVINWAVIRGRRKAKGVIGSNASLLVDGLHHRKLDIE